MTAIKHYILSQFCLTKRHVVPLMEGSHQVYATKCCIILWNWSSICVSTAKLVLYFKVSCFHPTEAEACKRSIVLPCSALMHHCCITGKTNYAHSINLLWTQVLSQFAVLCLPLVAESSTASVDFVVPKLFCKTAFLELERMNLPI